MILDCPACERLYSLEDYRPEERLRCRCGQIIIVDDARRLRTHTARSIHCATCGGKIEPQRATCPFCDALVDQTSARMSEFCAACYAMSREGASYCSGCGKPLIAVLDSPERTGHCCPRCKATMRRRALGGHKPLECPICCGLFVEPDDFESLMRAQVEREDRVEYHAGPDRALLDPTTPIYIPCPICNEMMNRTNYGRDSGVIIDYCRDDGYWLDPGELEKIARWIATGGTLRKYALDSQAIRTGHTRDKLPVTKPAPSSPQQESSPATQATDDDFLDTFLTFILGRK